MGVQMPAPTNEQLQIFLAQSAYLFLYLIHKTVLLKKRQK
jgi:hypothetical protein